MAEGGITTAQVLELVKNLDPVRDMEGYYKLYDYVCRQFFAGMIHEFEEELRQREEQQQSFRLMRRERAQDLNVEEVEKSAASPTAPTASSESAPHVEAVSRLTTIVEEQIEPCLGKSPSFTEPAEGQVESILDPAAGERAEEPLAGEQQNILEPVKEQTDSSETEQPANDNPEDNSEGDPEDNSEGDPEDNSEAEDNPEEPSREQEPAGMVPLAGEVVRVPLAGEVTTVGVTARTQFVLNLAYRADKQEQIAWPSNVECQVVSAPRGAGPPRSASPPQDLEDSRDPETGPPSLSDSIMSEFGKARRRYFGKGGRRRSFLASLARLFCGSVKN